MLANISHVGPGEVLEAGRPEEEKKNTFYLNE